MRKNNLWDILLDDFNISVDEFVRQCEGRVSRATIFKITSNHVYKNGKRYEPEELTKRRIITELNILRHMERFREMKEPRMGKFTVEDVWPVEVKDE